MSDVDYENGYGGNQTSTVRRVHKPKTPTMVKWAMKLPFIRNERSAVTFLSIASIVVTTFALLNLTSIINREEVQPLTIDDIPWEIQVILTDEELKDLIEDSHKEL